MAGQNGDGERYGNIVGDCGKISVRRSGSVWFLDLKMMQPQLQLVA
jgi:hypothetical protein